MYVSTTIALLTAALSAGALAFPKAISVSTPTTLPTTGPSALKARTDGTWVAGFHDSACNGPTVRGHTAADGTPVDAQPMDNNRFTCLTFNTDGEYLGIQFGDAVAVEMYTGAHCEGDPMAEWQNKDEGLFCKEQTSLFNGPDQGKGEIGSFLFYPKAKP